MLQVRLSERNVVELVNKLKAAGLLGDGLLHTVNGREYVTRKHLKKEIASAVDSAGGRIALVTACPCASYPAPYPVIRRFWQNIMQPMLIDRSKSLLSLHRNCGNP